MRAAAPGKQRLGPATARVLGRSELADLQFNPAEFADDQARALRVEERRRAETERAGASLGLPAERIFFLRQVHGARALRIDPTDSGAAPAADDRGEGDALYTVRPDVALGVRTADCLPLFFCLYPAPEGLVGVPAANTEGASAGLDVGVPTNSAAVIGVIHAGWRGMSAGIIEQTLRNAAEEARGLPPSGEYGAALRCDWALGPAIGGDVYEVGPEAAERFVCKRPQDRPGRPADRWLVDLAAEAALRMERTLASLARATAPEEHGRQARALRSRELEGCTYAQNDRWFSHRRGDAGRNLNLIMLA